jgi:hypothetical protein
MLLRPLTQSGGAGNFRLWIAEKIRYRWESRSHYSAADATKTDEVAAMNKDKPPAKADDKNQSKAFIEKARELGCDKNSAAADELLGRLARMPPKPHAKTKKAKPASPG